MCRGTAHDEGAVLELSAQLVLPSRLLPQHHMADPCPHCRLVCRHSITWSDLGMKAVVDVGGPHAREEKQDLMGEEVHGAEEQGVGVGNCLQHAVQGVEGKTSKGGQRVLLVVLVMLVVEVPGHTQSQGQSCACGEN